MSPQDEFFTSEEVDRQIDQVSQLKQGERVDAEVIASLSQLLRDRYPTGARNARSCLEPHREYSSSFTAQPATGERRRDRYTKATDPD